jgi:hypothetical protein
LYRYYRLLADSKRQSVRERWQEKKTNFLFHLAPGNFQSWLFMWKNYYVFHQFMCSTYICTAAREKIATNFHTFLSFFPLGIFFFVFFAPLLLLPLLSVYYQFSQTRGTSMIKEQFFMLLLAGCFVSFFRLCLICIQIQLFSLSLLHEP